MLRPIDVVDSSGRPTGATSNPEDANNRGLWHLGAHVILYAPSHKVLVQKRSPKSMQYPGMLDIGVGGFVDHGESPEQTAIRETREETGLDISPSRLITLGATRYNHRWRFRNGQKISRTIVYNYAAILSSEPAQVTSQPSEVAWIGFLAPSSVRWLIRTGSLARYGKLVPTYAYYRDIFAKAEAAMQKLAASPEAQEAVRLPRSAAPDQRYRESAAPAQAKL